MSVIGRIQRVFPGEGPGSFDHLFITFRFQKIPGGAVRLGEEFLSCHHRQKLVRSKNGFSTAGNKKVPHLESQHPHVHQAGERRRVVLCRHARRDAVNLPQQRLTLYFGFVCGADDPIVRALDFLCEEVEKLERTSLKHHPPAHHREPSGGQNPTWCRWSGIRSGATGTADRSIRRSTMFFLRRRRVS